MPRRPLHPAKARGTFISPPGAMAGFAALAFAASAAVAQTGTLRSRSLVVDGIVRTFNEYVPASIPATSMPVVFMLHGGGGTPLNAMATTCESRWNQLADRDRFIVVYPAGINNNWADCRGDAGDITPGVDDVRFLTAAIDDVASRNNIDASRVYASGHSNGSMMSFRLAMQAPRRFAAVAVSCGFMPAVPTCAPGEPVSIMLFAGTADPLMPFAGGQVAPGDTLNHGTVLSAGASIAIWVNFLGCSPTPAVTRLPNAVLSDGSTVTRYAYAGGIAGTEVVYLVADGAGHGWPSPTQFPLSQQLVLGKKNQDIVYCDEAWAFFQRHRLCLRPLLVTQPAPTQACLSDLAAFSVAVDGQGPIGYRWQWQPAGAGAWADLAEGDNAQAGGVAVLNARNVTSPTLEVRPLPPYADTPPRSFRCVVGNTCGSATSESAVLVATNCTDCIGDHNQDGGIDGADIEAFFVDWEQGMATADVNLDGGVDGADVELFFRRWEAGC